MKYRKYDEFEALVAEFRLVHRNLTDDELDKLIKTTFNIDQAALRVKYGVSDLMTFPFSYIPPSMSYQTNSFLSCVCQSTDTYRNYGY